MIDFAKNISDDAYPYKIPLSGKIDILSKNNTIYFYFFDLNNYK
jgi:hypothetical protein